MKKEFFFKAILGFSVLFSSASVFGAETILTSESRIDWTQNKFTSHINLDVEKANINLPSGKNSALNKIDLNLPVLIKDPLFSLRVNSLQSLGDLVLDETLTLEQITEIINDGKRTQGVFKNGAASLQAEHNLNLSDIGSLLVHHNTPYSHEKPIEQVASRKYTGIVIDARGKKDVHGEFVKDEVEPCFFPQIWDSEMNLIYERNMGDPEKIRNQGLVFYHWSEDENLYKDRIGIDPMRITARAVYGKYRTDPIISRKDALKLISVKENLELLKNGNVVILLDKDKLIHAVSAPEKNEDYYVAYRTIKNRLYNEKADPIVLDTHNGIQILYDLKFAPDSDKLLSSELPKIKNLAESLKEINKDNAFTILIEGHTADVNKPDGQMALSISRTQTIISELVAQGIDKSIFSYKGYGGTQPIASNETAAGRALNRRVIITARPKATYIQRQ